MTRKELHADFASCQAGHFLNIAELRQGDELGSYVFSYLSESLPVGFVNIHVIVPEVSEYPKTHTYMLFFENEENVPPALTGALETIRFSLERQSFSQMLDTVSEVLHSALNYCKPSNPISLDDDDDVDDDDDFNDDDDVEDDPRSISGSEDDFANIASDDGYPTSDEGDLFSEPLPAPSNNQPNSFPANPNALKRMRADLRLAKAAGFKIGILGDPNSGGIVCISVRVVKLGISEEAMQAWGLHRKHYIVLMIRFCDGYRDLKQVSEMQNLTGRTEIRVALCKRYKPNLQDALLAFTTAKGDAQPTKVAATEQSAETPTSDNESSSDLLEPLFIGRPLNDLLRTRFTYILKYRLACAFQWTGAEQFFNDFQGKPFTSENTTDGKYYVEDSASNRALPPIVVADAISDDLGAGDNLSLPLVAMQFLLRHFVRCTEFCLVCHCKVNATFEALKPYVCSKPLCLYQYMTLGFGPSIEWEILTQPYVVDLLVSFCYISARSGKLKDFPVGISLNVPLFSDFVELERPKGHDRHGYTAVPTVKEDSIQPEKSFTAIYDSSTREITVQGVDKCPVRPGDWLAMEGKDIDGRLHCRVEQARHFPHITLGQPVNTSTKAVVENVHYDPHGAPLPKAASTPAQSPKATSADGAQVECFLYDKSFDLLNESHKRQAVTALLDTLPDVDKMRAYLESQQLREPSLRLCPQISESALNLLRWIIASNRSCILQVNRTFEKYLRQGNAKPPGTRAATIGGAEDRVSGMDGWMQFRFAQGAPDKEQRFIDAVNEEARKNSAKYPTIFAWHGSALSNWHSIIREGLHFNETVHGRAYGNGVYMSPQATTSIGYTNMGYDTYGGYGYSGSGTWLNSVLRISGALALNEVVNSPKDFVSQKPHYVVEQIQWIQTRYLFVKASSGADSTTLPPATSDRPLIVYEQDPFAVVTGDKGTAITIPITAVSKSRRPAMSLDATKTLLGTKKVKGLKGTDQATAENLEDDANSVVSDRSDQRFLESDDEDELMEPGPEWPLSFRGSSGASGACAKRTSDVFDDDFTLVEPKTAKGEGRDKAKEMKKIKGALLDSKKTDFVPGSLDVSTLKILKPPHDAMSQTTKSLLGALNETLKAQERAPQHELGWFIDRELVSNMYQWIVELHSFDPTLPLAKDMKAAEVKSIVMEFRFTNGFPFTPPFVRVVKPRFLPFQSGGGGHVTAGGAICMELLTNSGWNVTGTIESVLLQIRMAMSSLEPRAARLQTTGGRGGFVGAGSAGYGVGEAMEAYKRACAMHGWKVPEGFEALALMREDTENSGF